ncbi:MAG: FtsQ-type POTRA domain-containing protein [Candidatus Pacebacteria bacterium]|nr:FtsQ-type POTRA domain-containing protein [Candidatus Paceibacterota bacterium]
MKRKKYKARKKFPFLFILKITLFFIIFYFLFFSNFFELKKIKADSLVLEVVKNNITREIGFLKTNNIFLLDIKKADEKLSEIIEIEKFSIKRKLPHTLIVNIEKRKETFICCSQDRCFKVDKNGIAFEQTNKTGYISCSLSEIGNKVMDEKIVTDILKIQKDLKSFFGELSFQNNSLILETNQGWRIFFNTEDNIEKQIARLFKVLEKTIKDHSLLDYIDLRYEETIYFK